MRDGVKLYTHHPRARRAPGRFRSCSSGRPYDATRAVLLVAPRRLAVAMGAPHARRRLHLRVPGSARAVPLGGRLCDVPRAARRLQQDDHRRDDRRLGHDRLAREACARPTPARSACGARRTRDGSRWRPCAIRIRRWRRRFRSTPSWTCGRRTTGSTGAHSASRTRSTSSTRWSRARARMSPTRMGHAISTHGSCLRDRPCRRSADGWTPAMRCGSASSRTRATRSTGATARRTAGSTALPAPCRRSRCTGCGIRRTSMVRQRPTRRSSASTPPTTTISSLPARGITASTSPRAAASARSRLMKTPRGASATTCSRRFCGDS